jgi:lysosomal acid phosphatase
LLGLMLRYMGDKSRGLLSPDRKMFMFSAHDRTLANLLMTLGVFDPQSPSYAAAVFVQLHRSSQHQFSVSVSLSLSLSAVI